MVVAKPSTVIVHVPIRFTVRGGRKTVVSPAVPQPTRTRFDDSVAKALARAFRWKTRLEDGTYSSIEDIASAEKMNLSYVARVLKLSLLAPDIVEAALNGRRSFTVEGLTKPLPPRWDEQRARLRFS